MNLVFVIGKIVSEIKFNFILNSKEISIVSFEIELNDKNILKVIGYNEIADFCYSKLQKENNIIIFGSLNSKGEVVIQQIEKFT